MRMKVIMKSVLTLGIMLVVPIVSNALTIGEQAPAMESPRIVDPANILKQSQGKIRYVDFWASWCSTCRNALPFVQDLQQRYGGGRFQVVAINLDTEREAAEKLLSTLRVNIPVVYDPEGKLPEQFDVSAMPSSFLLDQHGRVVAVWDGFSDLHAEQVEAQIKALLGS